jgi:hypothetical protein
MLSDASAKSVSVSLVKLVSNSAEEKKKKDKNHIKREKKLVNMHFESGFSQKA